MEPDKELTEWQCHKKVKSEKIVDIFGTPTLPNQEWDGSLMLVLENGNQVQKDLIWLEKHNPVVGGYFVRYKDGYESFSPAQAFEEGYTKLPSVSDVVGIYKK